MHMSRSEEKPVANRDRGSIVASNNYCEKWLLLASLLHLMSYTVVMEAKKGLLF